MSLKADSGWAQFDVKAICPRSLQPLLPREASYSRGVCPYLPILLRLIALPLPVRSALLIGVAKRWLVEHRSKVRAAVDLSWRDLAFVLSHTPPLKSRVAGTCHLSSPFCQRERLGASAESVPWHSLYKHSLYVTKFIRTFFIRDRVYTGQSLYRTKFIQGQNLYEDKVYTGTKFIRDKVHTVTKFIRGQSLYKLFHTAYLN